MRRGPSTGLVLSGGGARGAYEVGVLSGMVEVLRRAGHEEPPFDVFTGTSVGAINAAWLAAHADRPDLNIDGLVRHWLDLSLERHLRLDPLGLLSGPRLGPLLGRLRGEQGKRLGRSLLDPRALEAIVHDDVPYERLRENVRTGLVRALVVAALDVASGRTTMFVEVGAPDRFTPSRDPRRVGQLTPISAEHVLASAAIPLLFPARRIGDRYYCDGGVRFNTPISPAIRCGADRLVVISLLYPSATHTRDPVTGGRNVAAYPSPLFLMGKVMNALLLDPVAYDLAVLERLNRLIGVLEDTLSPEELSRVRRVMSDTRGVPYRRVSTLVFRPSANIGHMAGHHAQGLRARGATSVAVRRLAHLGNTLESDLLSFVLFDGHFARKLMDLGRRDALARAAEIERFFGGDHETPPGDGEEPRP